MQTFILSGLMLLISFIDNTKANSISTGSADKIRVGDGLTADAIGSFDAKTFLLLTPAKIQEMTGRKMNLGQKISLKMAQMEIKKQLRKGKAVNIKEAGRKVEAGVNFLWLLVGFLLGIAGVLIAYLTKEGPDDNRVKSAWIGFGISALLVILVYAVFFAIWASAGFVAW